MQYKHQLKQQAREYQVRARLEQRERAREGGRERGRKGRREHASESRSRSRTEGGGVGWGEEREGRRSAAGLREGGRGLLAHRGWTERVDSQRGWSPCWRREGGCLA
eukprot:749408-Rhodomonas_salina.1